MSSKKMNNNEHQDLNKVLNKLKTIHVQDVNNSSPCMDKLLNTPSELDKWWESLPDSNQIYLMCLIKQYVKTNSDELLVKIKENISPDNPPIQSIGSKLKI